MNWFWLAIFSALLSALAALLQKKVLKNISALDFSFIVSFLIAIFSTLLLFFADFQKVNSVSLTFLFIKSLLNATAFLCIMTSLKNLELSRALPLLASSPMVIALLAFIFLGEGLKGIEVTGMFLIVSGTYLLELKKNESVLTPFTIYKNSKYHRIILLALVLISVSSVMDKFILIEYKIPPLTFVFIQNLFFLFIFFVVYIFNKNKNKNKIKDLFKANSGSMIFVIIVIAIVTIGYRVMQIEAVKLAPVGIVISIKRLSVLFAVIIGAKLFKEESYFKKIIATILIVAGAMMIYRD